MIINNVRLQGRILGQEGLKVLNITPVTAFNVESLEILMDGICKSLVSSKVVSIQLPVHYTLEGETVAKIVPTDAVYKACVTSHITMLSVKEEVKMEEKVFTEDNLFDRLEKEIKVGTEKVMKDGTKKEIKNLLSAKDSDVYEALICTLAGMRMRFSLKLKDKEEKETMKAKEDIKETVKEVQDNPTVWTKVKTFIAFIVRKTAALLKGTLAFVFDATTVLGLMVGRVVYSTAREMAFASKAIGIAFKKDIIDAVKQA